MAALSSAEVTTVLKWWCAASDRPFAQFGVSGALANPFVSLFDGNGNVVYTNNNWKDTQQTAIQATGLAPPNDLESAILATPAGNYTAILSGVNGTSGVGLLEVYAH